MSSRPPELNWRTERTECDRGQCRGRRHTVSTRQSERRERAGKKKVGNFSPYHCFQKNADQDASTHTDLQNPPKYKLHLQREASEFRVLQFLNLKHKLYFQKFFLFFLSKQHHRLEKKDNNTGGGEWGQVGEGRGLGLATTTRFRQLKVPVSVCFRIICGQLQSAVSEKPLCCCSHNTEPRAASQRFSRCSPPQPPAGFSGDAR